jgi:TolB-like protein/DNA-binding winged helix-turn-helix (wHTH) protein
VIYRFDAYSLDTETLELKSGVNTITAQPQVFLLLQYLIENRERVVSRSDIIAAVWNGRIMSDSALAYAVKEARHLVGDDGKTQAVIRTLPRRGFRFVGEVTGESIGDEGVAAAVRVGGDAIPFAKPPSAKSLWRFQALAIGLVLIIAAGGLVWWQPWDTRVDPAALDYTVFPLPANPAIAVLPFANLSGDAFAEVLLVDVAENVATALSPLPEMLVIARSSTLPYKDKTVDAQQVAEELRVRYVLEGSVKRSGDQVRVIAKLIDAHRGHDLWRGEYNRELQDASAVQYEIAQNVVTALEVKLVEEAGARIVRGNTNNPEAYSLVRSGLSLFQGDTKEENTEARRLFEEAVKLDPSYSIGWHLLSYTHNAASRRGWSEGPTQDQARAEDLARKALAINPSAPGPYILLSTISRLRGRYNEAIAHGERAAALAPNDAMTLALLAKTLILLERPGPKQAIPLMRRAIDLNPYTPPPILFFEGLGYHSLGRYKEAISLVLATSASSAHKTLPLALLAITSADLGRTDEARVAVQAILNWNPRFSVKGFVNGLNYTDRTKSEHAIATLLQLGLPE